MATAQLGMNFRRRTSSALHARAVARHCWPQACGRPSRSASFVPTTDLWGGPLPDSPGSANLNWGDLGFEYVPTKGHVRHVFKEGAWDAGTFTKDPFVSVHILGNVFHYGQALFEGFKAFHTKDGSVATFIDHECLNRMDHGCRRFRMPAVPKALWDQAIDEVLRQNVAYIPPYGSGGALYFRPFIFGSGPRLGLGPSTEFTFVVFCNPVGSYYRTDQMQALDALVNDEYNRAAPLGCGDCKAAGNYAADLESMVVAKQRGFPISLYLDAKEGRYIEEFNTSNFVAITKDGRYITPLEPRSVLRGNTNLILRQLAADMGLTVEQRRIDFEAEVDTFAEVGAIGTAVVVTPINSLTRGDRVWQMGEPNVLKQLHDKVRGIQQGDAEDTHKWLRTVSLDHKLRGQMLSIYPAL